MGLHDHNLIMFLLVPFNFYERQIFIWIMAMNSYRPNLRICYQFLYLFDLFIHLFTNARSGPELSKKSPNRKIEKLRI